MCVWEAPARGPSGPAAEGAERRERRGATTSTPRSPPQENFGGTLRTPKPAGPGRGCTQGRWSPGRPRRLRSGTGLVGAGVLGAQLGLGDRARSDAAVNFSGDLYFLLFSFFSFLLAFLLSSPFCFSLFLFFLPFFPSLLSFSSFLLSFFPSFLYLYFSFLFLLPISRPLSFSLFPVYFPPSVILLFLSLSFSSFFLSSRFSSRSSFSFPRSFAFPSCPARLPDLPSAASARGVFRFYSPLQLSLSTAGV